MHAPLSVASSNPRSGGDMPPVISPHIVLCSMVAGPYSGEQRTVHISSSGATTRLCLKEGPKRISM